MRNPNKNGTKEVSVMSPHMERHHSAGRLISCQYFLIPIHMLLLIAVVLIVLWLIGVIAFPVIGSFIHILLVVAIIVVLVRIIRGG